MPGLFLSGKLLIKKYSMKNLQIDEKKARKLYATATGEFKTILEDTFGKAFFSQDPADFIKTYEDACNWTGERPIINSTDTPDEISYKKMKVIVKALNNDPEFPNYYNLNQPKYYPWVEKNKSGLGLSYDDYDNTNSNTNVRSHLVEYAV